MHLLKTAFALFLAGCASWASAGDIFGGSRLLSDSDHAQLERWLGAGEFHLHQLYARQPGDTSGDFHAAVDGKGATFSLIRVTNASGARFVVGGYNPQSWSSVDGWHITPTDAERTGFLFNLTVPALYHQVSSSYVLPSQGARQTFNGVDYGPTFGTGHDLYVNPTLDAAFSWQVTYGDPADSGASIVDRSFNGQIVNVDALEIFALSPVPEPASCAMLVAGLAVLAGAARRRIILK